MQGIWGGGGMENCLGREQEPPSRVMERRANMPYQEWRKGDKFMKHQIENMQGLIGYGWDKVLQKLTNNFRGKWMNEVTSIGYDYGLNHVPPKDMLTLFGNKSSEDKMTSDERHWETQTHVMEAKIEVLQLQTKESQGMLATTKS